MLSIFFLAPLLFKFWDSCETKPQLLLQRPHQVERLKGESGQLVFPFVKKACLLSVWKSIHRFSNWFALCKRRRSSSLLATLLNCVMQFCVDCQWELWMWHLHMITQLYELTLVSTFFFCGTLGDQIQDISDLLAIEYWLEASDLNLNRATFSLSPQCKDARKTKCIWKLKAGTELQSWEYHVWIFAKNKCWWSKLFNIDKFCVVPRRKPTWK